MNVKQVGVLGAGQMGQGIAQVAAQSGYSVVLLDRDQETADRGKEKIRARLDRAAEKGDLSRDDAKSTLERVSASGKIQSAEGCQLVVEAATENLELKIKLFKTLDEACDKDALIASNTSSISITTLAAATKRPEKIAGMHFMNPVPVMKLVEGIRGLQTSDETFSTVRKVAEKMGKTFIEAHDVPGFAVNRILMPMINEAIFALYEGVASAKDIDTAMKLGTNQPMGPLNLADFIGLDTCLAIMEVLHEGLGDSKYRPCPLLKKYVAAGWLGKKTGRGFFSYE